MRAAVLEAINQKLIVKEVPEEPLNEDEVKVNVEYCALNHRDYWISKGQYAGLKFPIILGSDVCGYEGDRRVLINPSMNWGDNQLYQSPEYKILGLPHSGGLASKLSISKKSVYDVPLHLNNIEASSLPLAGLTAYRALCTRANVEVKDKVFITGIGGGVALFAMQFAIAMGCEVYVSSSSDSKIEKAILMGAKAGINYQKDMWNKDFVAAFGGMDVIIDGAGGKDFGKLLKLCNSGARIISYGATQGAWEDISVQSFFWKQLNIIGSTMGSDLDFNNLLDFVAVHNIKPVVDRIFPLSEINEAFQYMSEGMQFGKIVIDIKN